MTDETLPAAAQAARLPQPSPEASVAAHCDHWRAQAQQAWQRIAELEYLLRVERGLRHVPPIKAPEETA